MILFSYSHLYFNFSNIKVKNQLSLYYLISKSQCLVRIWFCDMMYIDEVTSYNKNGRLNLVLSTYP